MVKILFINSQEPNQADLYFKGMKEIVGDDCIEYPYKPSYHMQLENGQRIARDLEGKIVLREDIFGVIRNSTTGWRAPRYFGLLDEKQYIYSRRIEPEISDFDAIVANLSSGSASIINKIFRKKGVMIPIILLDGNDDPLLRRAYFNRKITTYFKRELITDWRVKPDYLKKWGKFFVAKNLKTSLFDLDRPLMPAIKGLFNLKALNLTVDDVVSGPAEKTYDISFIANLTSPIRAKTHTFLRNYVKERGLNGFLHISNNKNVLPYSQYRDVISKSKISISVQGAGFDTYRYWEIPAFGSTLASEMPFISIENNFIDGESAIFFRSFHELENKLDLYLPDKWKNICDNGRIHFSKHHTPRIRAASFLKELVS